MNKFTISDFPVDFLSQQDSSFFSSQSYIDSKNLFNDLKITTPLLPSNNFTDKNLFTGLLSDKLSDKYINGNFSASNEDENLKILYLKMNNLSLTRKSNNKKIYLMDSIIDNIPTTFSFKMKRKLKSSNLVKINSNYSELRNTTTINSNDLIPQNTNDPVYDIINKYNFIKNNNYTLIDSIQINSNLYKELIKEIIIQNSSNANFINKRNSIIEKDNLKLNKNDLKNILTNLLLNKIFDKEKVLTNYELPNIETNVSENILNNFIQKEKYDYIMYNHIQSTSSSNWVVNHNLNINNILNCKIFYNGVLIPHTNINIVDSNTININFSSNRSGLAFIIFSTNNIPTLRFIRNELNDKRIINFKIKNTNFIDIYLENIKDGYCLDVYDGNNLITNYTITPLDKNKVRINFSNTISKGNIFITNTLLFNPKMNFITLTESNLLEQYQFILDSGLDWEYYE
jgi:hypothetical protein